MDSGTRGITPLETALRKDRVVVLAAVLVVAGLAWSYTIYVAWETGNLGNAPAMTRSMEMPNMAAWRAADWGAMFVMWAVMMAAMMAPTAAPMVLLFASVNRRRLGQQQPYVSSMVFLSGYLVIWVGFAAAATVGNWALHTHALLSSMMGSVMGSSTSSILGGSLLLASGIFQWTPLKDVCLSRCRTPWGFIMSYWREGKRGALLMGMQHGLLCLGCCWMLMALLFVLGVMNLVWIAALAAFVLLEKVGPRGKLISRCGGLVLMAWGVWVILGPVN